ncbi:MAG: hypothetical protein ACI3X3_00215, partial [Acidaminococcus sp.]|uniref:hypothetical protein n=1 Tax=Acidaminococcus sp. TaxID=1872103 RepID=UPI003F166D28
KSDLTRTSVNNIQFSKFVCRQLTACIFYQDFYVLSTTFFILFGRTSVIDSTGLEGLSLGENA